MFEIERNRDEVVVTYVDTFDVVDDGHTLVLSVKAARKLAEALMEGTVAVDMFAMEEDG